MEDNRVSHQEFLVARSDKGGKEVHRRMQCMPKKQKLHRGTCQKTHAKHSAKKTLDTHLSRLYYKAAASTRI